MSADNRTACPKCMKRNGAALAAAEASGNAAEVFRMRTILANPPDDLREYWEIFMTGPGIVTIRYCALCDACGFTFKFEDSKDAMIQATEVT